MTIQGVFSGLKETVISKELKVAEVKFSEMKTKVSDAQCFLQDLEDKAYFGHRILKGIGWFANTEKPEGKSVFDTISDAIKNDSEIPLDIQTNEAKEVVQSLVKKFIGDIGKSAVDIECYGAVLNDLDKKISALDQLLESKGVSLEEYAQGLKDKQWLLDRKTRFIRRKSLLDVHRYNEELEKIGMANSYIDQRFEKKGLSLDECARIFREKTEFSDRKGKIESLQQTSKKELKELLEPGRKLLNALLNTLGDEIALDAYFKSMVFNDTRTEDRLRKGMIYIKNS